MPSYAKALRTCVAAMLTNAYVAIALIALLTAAILLGFDLRFHMPAGAYQRVLLVELLE